MRRDSLNPFEYVAGASSVATYRASTLSPPPSPSLSLLFIFLLQFVLLVVALEARSVVGCLLAVCGFVFPIELQNCQLVKVEVACKTPLLSPLPLAAPLLSCICLHVV